MMEKGAIKKYILDKIGYKQPRVGRDFELVQKIMGGTDGDREDALESMLSHYPKAIPYAKRAFLQKPSDDETKYQKVKRAGSVAKNLVQLLGSVGWGTVKGANAECVKRYHAAKAKKEEAGREKPGQTLYEKLDDVEPMTDSETMQAYDEYAEWAKGKDLYGECCSTESVEDAMGAPQDYEKWLAGQDGFVDKDGNAYVLLKKPEQDPESMQAEAGELKRQYEALGDKVRAMQEENARIGTRLGPLFAYADEILASIEELRKR